MLAGMSRAPVPSPSQSVLGIFSGCHWSRGGGVTCGIGDVPSTSENLYRIWVSLFLSDCGQTQNAVPKQIRFTNAITVIQITLWGLPVCTLGLSVHLLSVLGLDMHMKRHVNCAPMCDSRMHGLRDKHISRMGWWMDEWTHGKEIDPRVFLQTIHWAICTMRVICETSEAHLNSSWDHSPHGLFQSAAPLSCESQVDRVGIKAPKVSELRLTFQWHLTGAQTRKEKQLHRLKSLSPYLQSIS